ncbi:hypothetical protein [Methanoculleus sp. 10]|uniref:hypothetical protein n=1 Tax=Methanoculleus sp. 10 TaxID=430615 RepID=UPI0025E573FB|nr:hypothetical protein [Methanoculleus sp. 10]
MTHSSLLRHDQTLFRDPEAFEPTFVPDHLHHRDAQVRELAFLIPSATLPTRSLRRVPGAGLRPRDDPAKRLNRSALPILPAIHDPGLLLPNFLF